MSVVLVTSRSFSSGSIDVESRLRDAGAEIVRGPSSHDLSVLRELLARADAWIAGTGPVSADHLAAAPRLQVVARYGVGVDAVDLAAARAAGVVVTNTPGANTEAVADHTIALLLAAVRSVVAGDRAVRDGDWRLARGREVGSLRIGLIGVGRIGSAVARRLHGFGAPVLGTDPQVSEDELRSRGIEPAGTAIPADVDVVSLHAPSTDLLVDRRWVRSARAGLILVNTARATLVDEHAVADGLRSGQLSAYATDVLSTESGQGPSPLLDPVLADRVTLTPHWAAQTSDAVDRMGTSAVDSVLDVLARRTPAHTVTREESR